MTSPEVFTGHAACASIPLHAIVREARDIFDGGLRMMILMIEDAASLFAAMPRRRYTLRASHARCICHCRRRHRQTFTPAFILIYFGGRGVERRATLQGSESRAPPDD